VDTTSSFGEKVLLAVVVGLIGLVVFVIFAFSTHATTVNVMCKRLGWDEGDTRSWFIGVCIERNGEERHTCRIEDIQLGTCERLWAGE
jgi:hypothetical protein